MIDVSSLVSAAAYAGGLFIEPMDGMTGISMGGTIQNELIFGLELGYANQLVDIAEIEQDNNIKIYPNPVGSELNLDLENNFEGSYIIQIFSLLGQRMINLEVDLSAKTTIHIDTGVLENGIYFLRISDSGGRAISRSFVRSVH